ncbi:acetyl-CoA C-acetyltransferase [Phaeovibrio sulfidiphilus]|uniref:Acetyl-CoA C-acetyltransferase n=1 Tax=Phaeovibrio sulfidiphilus TaxID=1220600 RepID=A0A8J6YQG6_9PROT|nr:acetyl-CoA C-acetyltransferase [Phaeovibrio sulfidiphilus]MBE1237944.1 acetyl-CoA C-acetyltransferase [Phaeovibrio sulfidiphilus]
MTDIVIAGAARTPIGSFGGAFAGTPANRLGTIAIAAALERAGVAPSEVDEVIMGNVLQAGQGQNPARQMSLGAGLPVEIPAWTVNILCGSGLYAVALAARQIRAGDARILVAGGAENMSLAPYLAPKARFGARMGNTTLVDSLLSEGLTDVFNGYHMGITAENVAKKYGISRADQDACALTSQQRAIAAIDAGAFKKEIVPVTLSGRKGDVVVDTDEYPRRETSAEGLARLRPAFKADDGTVTAGNSSGINDGAAALVVMDAALAREKGLKPLARVVSWAAVGNDPAYMGVAPIEASRKALDRAGWSAGDLDLIEANEAFAAQAVAVARAMGFAPDRLNVNGGAIALGHPIGCSGARILTTLLYGMEARGARRGLATLCVGGGMGVAVTVERD